MSLKQNWDNEIQTTFTVVTPPSLRMPTDSIKIFLAGSINEGKAYDWQKDAISFIKNEWNNGDGFVNNVTVYNSRADELVSDDKDSLNELAIWSLSMLECVDYIVLHLSGGKGLSPISLLELGIYMRDPRLYLSIDDDYLRKYIVEVHCSYFGMDRIYKTYENSIQSIQDDWYKKKGIE